MAFGAAMRAQRESLKLSMREVAIRMDFTAQYIGDLELGKRSWSETAIRRYKEALKQ